MFKLYFYVTLISGYLGEEQKQKLYTRYLQQILASPSPNLDKHSLLSNEIIKVFLGTLILAVPVWPAIPAAKPIRYQPEQFQS